MGKGPEYLIPPEFSVLYSPGLITNIARKTQETINGEFEKNIIAINLSEEELDGELLELARTKLFINKVTTSINTTLLLGKMRDSESKGYFSKNQIRNIQDRLRGRDLDSTSENVRGRNVLLVPRRSDIAFVEIDMGYPNTGALLEFLESGERLTKAEKDRQKKICGGDERNSEINIRLSVENEWITNVHAGPVVFEFYFKRYEAFLKSLYQAEGYPLPQEPIRIKPH